MNFFHFLAIFCFLNACSSFGTRPNELEKENFKKSKHFNAEKGAFENRRPGLIEAMKKRTMSWGMVQDWFKAGMDRVPAGKLPEVRPDIARFLEPSDDLKVIWFGHSSFLLNMDNKVILVDPVFSEAASPVSFMVQRFQKPVLELKELPKIDYLLISHDHYDHLDTESIKFFVDEDITFVTPLGVGSHLRGWGVPSEKIIEKDWWESEKLEGIEFIATPAQHFSGRNGIYDNETLWASWVIKSENHNIYFSGDSGYDTHFKEIGNRFGPFEVAFLETGQYDKKWEEVHMPPEEAVIAFRDLRAKKYFPVHWGMFELALHPWFDPIERIFKLSKEQDLELIAPKIGAIVSINESDGIEKWWESVPKEIK